jgi:hypothetical protein
LSRGLAFVYLESIKTWVNLSLVSYAFLREDGTLSLSYGSYPPVPITDPDEIQKVRDILDEISR